MVVRLPEEAMKLRQTLTNFVRRQSHGVACAEKATQPHSREDSMACVDTDALLSIGVTRGPSNARTDARARSRSLKGRKPCSNAYAPAVRLRRCAAVARLDLGAGCWLLDAGLEGAGR